MAKFTPLPNDNDQVELKFPDMKLKKEKKKEELKFTPLTASTASQLPEDQLKTRTSIMDELSAMRKVASIPSEVSRGGLKKLADLIPAPEPREREVLYSPENRQFEVGKSGGTPVEQPRVTNAGVSPIQSFPKIAADVVADMIPSFIHPDVLAFAGGAKGVGAAAKSPAGKRVFQKLGELTDKHTPTIKKWLTYRHGQDTAYKDAAEQLEINLQVGTERVGTVGKNIIALPAGRQRKITQYLTGTKNIKLSKNDKLLADAARGEFKRMGKDLVDLGLLDAETYAANVNRYLPTMYKTKELGLKTPNIGTKKPMRMNIDRMKKKQDLDPEAKKALVEILEAGYPTSKGLMQLNQAVEKGKMFDKVSKMSHIATADKAIGIKNGWNKLPVTPKLGRMSGVYAEQATYDDLMAITKESGAWGKGYKKTLSAWKYGKVVLSPSTHARNMFTNAFWLDVSGVGPAKQAKLLPKALKEIRNKGLFYKEAQRQGLVGSEMVGSDIMKLQGDYLVGGLPNTPMNMMKKAINYGKTAAGKMGDVYQGEEQVFKIAKFMDNLAKGMPKREAALEAETWIFNYGKISPAVKQARESIIPFATYFSKAIPQLGKAVVDNPLAVYKYTRFFQSLENVAAEQHGLSKGQVKAIKEQYGVNIIPGKRKDGRVQTLDLDFLTPWGEATQMSNAGLPQPFTPSGPLFALNNALLSHYDPFTKRELSDARDITDYLGKAMLPNLTPGVPGVKSWFKGGYHFQDMMDAARGEPRYPKKESRSMTEAMLGSGVGLKTRGVDPNEAMIGQAKKTKYGMSKLKQNLDYKMKHKGVTKKDRKWLMKKYPAEMKQLQKEHREKFMLKPDIEKLQKGIKKERKFTPLR